jgi:predicted PurR-regulated permease PerM
MLGTILTAILQGALGAIGFAIFGLPSPIVFGAIMAVLSLLPVGGTAFVWLPAAVVLVAQGAWGRGIGLFVWGLVIVGLADNWFKPMIISGHSEMNTLPVFFGVMGGLAAFGFLGLFVGPMVVSLGIAVLETASTGGTAGRESRAALPGG